MAPALARQEPKPAPPPSPPAGSPLVAQDQPDPYEDRPIREVRLIKLDPERPNIELPLTGNNAQIALNQLRTHVGAPFRRKTVTDDVTRLDALGRFSPIKSLVQLQSDGAVVVIFQLGERAIVQDVQIVGNREISDQEAMAIAGAIRDTAVDRFQIDRAARGIEGLYREKGFYAARVEVDEKELAASNILVYRVIEGERVRVMGVLFEGARSFSPKELRSAIRTTEYIPIFDAGPLDDDVRKDDEAAIFKFYRDRGYLDVRVSSTVKPAPNGREAIVTFEIDEGVLYSLRSVQVRYRTADALAQFRNELLKEEDPSLTPEEKELRKRLRANPVAFLTPRQMAIMGRRCYTSEQIAGLMVLKPGDVFSDDRLKKSIEAIKAAYGKLGNVAEDAVLGPGAVRISHDEVIDEHKPEVDLILTIDEGRPVRVGNIEIRNNEHTKQQVILHQIQIKPDRPLDAAALAESRRFLEDLRLFEPRSVKVSIQPENEPGVRDVLFEVQETNTGSFNFGVAVNSDAGVLGQISLTQKNFDILNPPDSVSELFSATGFRGGGQTASLVLLPGTQTQNYAISLLEPHFMDSDFSTFGSIYYKTRDYSAYDEKRVGTAGAFGRRFGTVWDGSIKGRVEGVEISDIDASSPVDLFDVQGYSLLTGLGVEVARDTTDSRIRPTKGSRWSMGVEQVGALGGDYDFTRFVSQYVVFLKLYESFLGYKTLLKVENSVGWIPQGQGAAPVFERFYLGGQSFRGYAVHGVSPAGIRNDTGTLGDDAVGGAFEFFLGTEIQQPLYQDILAGVLFLDTGTVQTKPGFDQYRMSAGFGFRVFVPQISPVPLAFDFGFPFMKQDSDHERVFTFSIDLPF